MEKSIFPSVSTYCTCPTAQTIKKIILNHNAMKFSREELKYMQAIMNCTNHGIVAQKELNHPSVSHNKLQRKIEDMIYRLS